MNREIIFRGKRIDNGEWVEGDLLTKRNALSSESAIIFFDDHIIPRSPAVNLETVGQYTGLNDCRGRRIFEGDIVKFKLQDADEYRFAKILYGEFVDENDSQFYLGFYVVGMGCTFSIFNGKDEGYDFIGMCEVCGNIHDIPGLLEEL